MYKIENKFYIGAKNATMRRDLVRREPSLRGEERVRTPKITLILLSQKTKKYKNGYTQNYFSEISFHYY